MAANLIASRMDRADFVQAGWDQRGSVGQRCDVVDLGPVTTPAVTRGV
jgi:hypothetical protein